MRAEHEKMLVVDMGNTCMMFGLYAGEKLVRHWQLASARHITGDELAMKLHGLFVQHGESPDEVHGIMAASVIPHLDTVLAEACLHVFGKSPAFVGTAEIKTGMAVDYKNPKEVGADRIANAIAARAAIGNPVIVVDCGTATTFDIVSPDGHYAGGLILPGIEMALSALSERAAKLPEAPFARTDELIGRDTVTSMQAGSYWSAVEGISGIIRRLRDLAGYEQAPVIMTGGLASRIIDDVPEISAHRPFLTLDGLRLLAERHFA